MGSVLQFDEAASRRAEATYMTPDVVQQRRVVRDALSLKLGEDVLDIGSGPGLLAAEIAAEVGSEGSVQGIEPSDSMRALAARRGLAPSSAQMEFRAGDACALPFAAESFDVAIATQVYEYVEDMPAALAEAYRVLRSGGRLLVLDTDWDSIVWHSSDRARMQRVLAAWDEHLVDPYLPRRLTRLLEDAGFAISQRTVVPLLNAGYDPNSFSAGLIDFVAGFVPGRNGLTKTDATAWADDLVSLGGDYFFSLNRYMFVAVK
jgi:ubiquinone/menaquinone biosynthesis C-methylase UbiE